MRYHQRLGLIIEPDNPWRGYREYADTTFWRLKFIKRARAQGFSLLEIRELLELSDGHSRDAQRLTTQKLEQIEHQLRD